MKKKQIKEKSNANNLGAGPMSTHERGITLISLIITIIILLILAGVAINLTIGENGIFKLAKYATDKYQNTAEQEASEIAKLENNINSTREEIDNSIRFRQIVTVNWTKTHSGYISNTATGSATIDLTGYNFSKIPYGIVSGTGSMTATITSISKESLSFNWRVAWPGNVGSGHGTVQFMLLEPF